MFKWFKKAKEVINPPSLFDKVKKYLEENAPDILENLDYVILLAVLLVNIAHFKVVVHFLKHIFQIHFLKVI